MNSVKICAFTHLLVSFQDAEIWAINLVDTLVEWHTYRKLPTVVNVWINVPVIPKFSGNSATNIIDNRGYPTTIYTHNVIHRDQLCDQKHDKSPQSVDNIKKHFMIVSSWR